MRPEMRNTRIDMVPCYPGAASFLQLYLCLWIEFAEIMKMRPIPNGVCDRRTLTGGAGIIVQHLLAAFAGAAGHGMDMVGVGLR